MPHPPNVPPVNPPVGPPDSHGQIVRDCLTCQWFVVYENEVFGATRILGCCHRFPPMRSNPVGHAGTVAEYAFPIAGEGQWCGEWEKKKN